MTKYPALMGVDKFLADNNITGEPASIIKAWAMESIYWNALMMMDPIDIVIEVGGSPSAEEMEAGLIERIKKRLKI